ncbi:MAG TPA: tRNA(His) guanylyltransferase Thg1 family protein [Methanocella sp.]|uniref:tRNA(His) guanylyltransferase Thg1 family protein n=1 Tax=Methanocella sp. TaxID=2052833 RepID=UPI002B7592BD|nr:tRNA(His) guanylyltransferase Thg1 family protein [Methanocella sp.]HTY91161.1 tRNA(His) guanylyltransferase Thg1 family protein [Methanocella sp.]
MADERFKVKEIYKDIRALPPVVIRADGRNFKESLARLRFKKPYDLKFEKAMMAAGRALMESSGLGPLWVYTFSDEFNIFFKDLPFDGRVEKLDSVVPSFLSSALTLALKLSTPLAFDARVVPLHYEDVAGYLQWRQAEAWRNHMQSYGFYMLIREGLAEPQASKQLRGMKFEDIHEMMWRRGVNLNETPAWQRKGVFIYKKMVVKRGFDQGKKENVRVRRTEVEESWDPPLFGSKEGEAFLKSLKLF